MRPGQSRAIGWLGRRWTAAAGWAPRDSAGQRVRTPQRPRPCGPRGRCATAAAPSSAWTRLALPSGCRGSPVKCLAASSACRSRRVPQRDRLPPRSRGPRAAGAACRGGAGARSRGLTSLPGQLGGGGGGGRGSAAHLQWGRGGKSRAAALPMRSGPEAGSPASVGGPRSRHCRDPWLQADPAQAL